MKDGSSSRVSCVGPSWARISVRRLLGIVLACGLACALMVWLGRAVEQAREAARDSQCICNLCQIRLAMHNYHATFGSLPPAYVADAAGKPMHSWRVLLLPFMEQSALYNQYDFSEPWNGPNNVKVMHAMPNTFSCPSGREHPTTLTSYVVVRGPGTAFPDGKCVSFADIHDGTSNTMIVAEVANVKVHWTEPKDLDIRTMSFLIDDPARPGISSPHSNGPNCVFADASTQKVPHSITPANLKALLTIDGHEPITRDEALKRH